jgi:hypothetical protein
MAGRARRTFVATSVVCLLLLLGESRLDLPQVHPPTAEARWTAVNRALAGRQRGLTAELPVVPAGNGVAWGYVEAPRQFLARIDDQPRVNGYSGYEPHDFERVAAALNSFPAPRAVVALDALGVRYVIVRRSIVGDFDAGTRAQLEAAQPAVDLDAVARLEASPPPWAASVRRIGDATLVTLAPRPTAG